MSTATPSSASTQSPGCLRHSRIVPSETEIPILGIHTNVPPASSASRPGADGSGGLLVGFCTGYQDPIIAKQLGSDGDFFMGGNAYSPELAAKYMRDVAPVEAIYKAKTTVVFDGDAIQEAIALNVLAQAIEKAGSLDTQKVVKILHTETFDSPLSLSGKVAFGEDGQNKLAKSVLTQLNNLNYVPVFPASYAEGKPVFPMPAWK